MAQLARMYLRGSICNKTMKELTEPQRLEIEEIINLVVEDPNLQQCRHEFRNALARTIRNEYIDPEAGEQDYRIAIMRAAVAAKHGWAGKQPATEALTDPIQRKKWFQTWAFNYLRQILRENKIPSIKSSEKLLLPADTAALSVIDHTLSIIVKEERDVEHRRILRSIHEKMDIIEVEEGYDLFFDHWSFPIVLVSRIQELANTYFRYNIGIVQTMDGVEIRRLVSRVPEVEIVKHSNALIRELSFDAGNNDEEHHRDQLEIETMKTDAEVVDEDDIITRLKRNIPTEAQQVLDIYIEETRPNDYIERYGSGTPKTVHIAEYLNKTPKEVKNLLRTIKIHCIALGIGR